MRSSVTLSDLESRWRGKLAFMEKAADISVVILYKAASISEFVREMKELLETHGLSYELVLVANYNAHEKHGPDTNGGERTCRA